MTGMVLALVAAFLIPGIILRVKSLASGRKGPGILQPWYNIGVIVRKERVVGNVTGFVYRLAPVVNLATLITAMLLLPFPGQPSWFGFEGDFVLFAYLLGLGKLFMILGALETGSSFEGMGASREALYSMLTEPAFFILFGTMALLTGNTSMEEIFTSFRFAGHSTYIVGFIAVYLLTQIAMIENSRMPVDDPKTHLELTMVHEVMILDYSGFELALIHIGTALKFSLFGMLIANFLIPADGIRLLETSIPRVTGLSSVIVSEGGSGWIKALQLGAALVIQVIFAALIGLMESFRARKKLARNPQFIVTLSSIALVAFILVLLITHKMTG